MAEYWKSLPRKFCDVCKCWFADNKASIDFHERGKRHQENAQKRIQDIQKRGIKEFKKQKKLEDDMEKIEKAALAAYQKDLQNMKGENKPLPELVPKKSPATSEVTKNAKISNDVSQKKKEIVIVPKKEIEPLPVEPPTVPTKLWYEGVTEEGYKYYWNSETTESKWEPPEEGYISIEEQNESEETINEEQKVPDENNSVAEDEDKSDDNEDELANAIGPQPKVDPYGQWTTVEKEEPVEYDLQLPKQSENIVEVVIPIYKDGPSLKFKEKIIGQLTDSDSSNVTFKKRKFSGSFKRNARQRTVDDD